MNFFIQCLVSKNSLILIKSLFQVTGSNPSPLSWLLTVRQAPKVCKVQIKKSFWASSNSTELAEIAEIISGKHSSPQQKFFATILVRISGSRRGGKIRWLLIKTEKQRMRGAVHLSQWEHTSTAQACVSYFLFNVHKSLLKYTKGSDNHLPQTSVLSLACIFYSYFGTMTVI